MDTRFWIVILGLGLAFLLMHLPCTAQVVADNGGALTIEPSPRGARCGDAPGSITTMFAFNNVFAGNMFDIQPYIDLTITAVDINVSPPGDTAQIDVWYYDGTCVGHELEGAAGGWRLLGSGAGVIAGADLPTFIEIPNNETFEAGKTYGIYVDLVNYSSDLHILYTNSGPNLYFNDDLSLTTHCGNGSPAFTSYFYPRAWNGTLYYDTQAPSPPMTLSVSPDPLLPGQIGTFKVSNAGLFSNVWLAYSLKGTGSTFIPSLNVTLDLRAPKQGAGPTKPNLLGYLTWELPIPMSVSGRNVWFQAVQEGFLQGRVSNVVATSIQ